MMFFQRMATRLESAVSWSRNGQWSLLAMRNAGGTTEGTHCISWRSNMICSFCDDGTGFAPWHGTSYIGRGHGGFAAMPPVFRRL